MKRHNKPLTRKQLQLIESELPNHRGALWRMAHFFARTHPESGTADDFHQEAQLGLMRAARTFDPDRHFKFLTYATWWIRNYCQRFAASGGVIRLPTRPRAAIPTVGQMPLMRDKEGGLDEVQFPAREPDRHLDPETLALVRDSLRVLDERSRQVIELRYGLNGRWPMSLSEVGQVLGVCNERVRQIQEMALARLREQLAGVEF